MNKRTGAKASPVAGGSGGAHAIPERPLAVLHIDDDPNDVELLRAAVVKAGVQFRLYTVEDGEQAMAYLSGRGRYADRERHPLPALILLDLKMPRNTGFDILKWIREHSELNHMPVVILSGSELKDDIHRAYETGANSYLIKPLGFEALVGLVKNIHNVWLGPGAQDQPRL